MTENAPTTTDAQYPYRPSAGVWAKNDEVDLREYWDVVTQYKVLIGIVTGVTTTVALAAAFLMTPIYRAETLLAPATSEKSGGLSALATQFGDLAALAGISVGGGDRTQEAIATLKSRALTEVFIKENNLLPILFQDAWDADNKTWKARDPTKRPTIWQAHKVFEQGIRTVSFDKKSGLVTLAIEWKDPAQAAEWANDMVRRVNRQRQQEAIEEARSSIEYLYKQLAKTSSIEVEQAIYRLIEAQTKTIMVAQAREEYAFKVIDPAVVPEERIKPKRRSMAIAGLLLGVLLGISLAFAANFLRIQPTRSN